MTTMTALRELDRPALWPRILLWSLVAVLCCFGLVMIASTTATMGKGGTLNYSFLTKQVAAMAVGLVGAIAVSWIGAGRLQARWLVLAAVGAAILSLVAVKLIGRSINGAQRWIDLGPINLQPAEIAKLALVLGAAWHFSRVGEAVRSVWHGVLLPLAGFAVLAGLVFATKDLGSVVVMFIVFAGMVLWSGASWLYLLGLSLLAMPIVLFHAVFRELYRWERMMAFWDPFNASGPAGYHLVQSMITVGTGGVWGVGLGNSAAKLNFLPEKHTDFIYAVICEEFGMVGALGVAGLFLALVVTGLVIAMRARNLHGRLLAVGATLALGIQAFWNMLVPVAAVPTKGLTLPFISYGGSSVAICLVLIGILDAVARASTVRHPATISRRPLGASSRSTRKLAWSEKPETVA
jgi:cell division protein FtsW